METKWALGELQPDADRSKFESSEPALTKFFRDNAGQYQRNNWARVYVATHPDNLDIGGYYTLNSANITTSHLPETVRKKLPRGDVPTIHIGRLAVDVKYQGQGLGGTLLVHALKNAYTAHKVVGAYAVHVKPIDAAAKSFYEYFGFQQCELQGLDMFLPMSSIKDL
jgi:GNAT superfamily N-acetyltransferase